MKCTVCVLSEIEASEIVKRLMTLEKMWAKRSSTFATLGAIAYIDSYDTNGNISFHLMGNFVAQYQLLNPVLNRNFGDLYEKITTCLSKELDAPVEICSEIPHPGFQLFFSTPEYADKLAAGEVPGDFSPIHADAPYRAYLPFWDQFSEVDWINTLSFTLPLELPAEGSGLNFWPIIDPSDLDELIALNDSDRAVHVGPWSDSVEYTCGELSYFIGHYVHQIKHLGKLNANDRRITLQGHGVKCDGVWKLYV